MDYLHILKKIQNFRNEQDINDSMDIIVIIIKKIPNEKIRPILEYLISDNDGLDFPVNIKLPIITILNTKDLLEGIIRYIK